MFPSSGQGIAFDGSDEWNFNNGSDRNVIIRNVCNSSLFQDDNQKNHFFNFRTNLWY